MSSYRTINLAKEFYRLGRRVQLPFPQRELFLRSTSSIVVSLAEGNTKRSNREKLPFYEAAHSSFRVSVATLELEQIENDEIFQVAGHLEGSLRGMIQALGQEEMPIAQMQG